MFSVSTHLPSLHIGRIALDHYEERWLQRMIQKAAHKAGHGRWFFAEHVARGVIEYLRQRFERQSITLEELFAKIDHTLRSIGFKDIANELQAEPPPIDISLTEIVREASGGFELRFFSLLEQHLADARRLGASEIRLSGLREAVKLLRNTDRWGKSCQQMHDYVLTFVPDRASRYGDSCFCVLIR